MAYLRTRALWLPWGFHFAWNATLGLVFGLPVSGLRLFNVVVHTTATGRAWLTGGAYGMEASLPGALVVLVALVIVWRAFRFAGSSTRASFPAAKHPAQRNVLGCHHHDTPSSPIRLIISPDGVLNEPPLPFAVLACSVTAGGGLRLLVALPWRKLRKAASSSPTPTSSEKMTPQTRIQVIRSLQAERVFARVLFPQGDKGLKLKDGVISPNEMAIAQQIAEYGAAVKPGDRCVITDVKIKDKEIILEINGGTKKNAEVVSAHSDLRCGRRLRPIPGGPSPQSLDAHGSSVTLEFDKYVPEVSGDQVRAMLAPVFDFKALTGTEAYQKTLPPKLQAAIRDHKVLVGMDKEMVMYAKGRPQQRIRDKDDQGQDYEEWIYGRPPEEVEFVRFKGNEVARLEIMTVDGKKTVRTEREVDLPAPDTEVAEKKPAPKPQAAPTLRRPGRRGRVSYGFLDAAHNPSARPPGPTRRFLRSWHHWKDPYDHAAHQSEP